MPTPFGFGIMVSDICVSLANGDQLDCLQKIHAVGPGTALGFAGSVSIGFAMVDALRDALTSPAADALNNIDGWWPKLAAEVFAAADHGAKADDCALMLMFSVPSESGSSPWPRTVGNILRAPSFAFEPLAGMAPAAIGSGAHVSSCIDALRRIAEDRNADGLLKSLLVGPGAMASAIGLDFTRTLQEDLPPGISPHLHVCIVASGRVNISPFDYRTFEKDGSTVDFKMPPVARSLSELVTLLGQNAAIRGTASTYRKRGHASFQNRYENRAGIAANPAARKSPPLRRFRDPRPGASLAHRGAVLTPSPMPAPPPKGHRGRS